MTKVNGMAVTFAMDMEYVYVEKPEWYSVEKAEDILKSYAIEEDFSSETEYPNVIVVMNEAFSDLAVLGDFTTNQDYMPFIHQLQQGYENTVTGNLMVSVTGGNTTEKTEKEKTNLKAIFSDRLYSLWATRAFDGT